MTGRLLLLLCWTFKSPSHNLFFGQAKMECTMSLLTSYLHVRLTRSLHICLAYVNSNTYKDAYVLVLNDLNNKVPIRLVYMTYLFKCLYGCHT